MQFPLSDLVTDFQSRFLRDTRAETTEELPCAIDALPWAERISQEVERLVWVTLLPIGILAVNELRFLRMEFQSALLQPCRYVDTY